MTTLTDVPLTRAAWPFIDHNCEHYGRLTVYKQLGGVVRPLSRGV